MSQPAAKKVKPQRSLVARIVFFCLHPVVLVIIAAAVAAVVFAAPFRLLITPAALPEFAGPEQEAFWTLQKKLVDLEISETTAVTLTHSEFNAFLSGYQLPPEKGFCLQRLRFSADKDGATLYVTGSGFFMRSLIFQLGISAAASQMRVNRLQINSLVLDADTIVAKHVLQYLKDLAMKNAEGFVARIIEGKCRIEFGADLVVLKGEFMAVRPKPEAEEMPTVENESPEAATGLNGN
ncbi:MAG TPA: hypothetical protein DCG57_20215 [Candidatus Riflebacteria bacterium]|jgi:hypothetical protein|nr:hypothetical protein [Candidatus Riflebacteria bacterium]